MQADPSDGELIGAYRVEAVVGSGGMGTVYRARHALNGRVVALKVQRRDTQATARARDRMMREAQILATLAHPGVPRFFEVGLLDDDRAWIAMELVEGTCLTTRLAQGPVSGEEVASMVGSVAAVLAVAHASGTTHRDLKPDNVYLTPNDPYPLRVLDWGIALDSAGVRFTNHDEAIGTPTYMAPEQARGGPTGGHCDVYALGVIAYHALSGEPPFSGTNPVEILLQHFHREVPALGPRCPDVTYGLVDLVERMLGKQHEERPTAVDVHAALARMGRAVDGHEYDVYDLAEAVPTALPSDQVTTRLRVRT
jgi:serine/threonine protein kinase